MPDPFGRISTVLRTLIERFESSQHTYAFGGAIALAAWSEPRATADIDLVVWVEPDGLGGVLEILKGVGADVREDMAQVAADRDGMFVTMVDGIRVDVFVPSIPFYDEAAKRRVRTRILGLGTWIHSAEVLAVFKLLFFRAKDLIDIRRMIEVRMEDLDREFVRRSIADMLGEDDPRIMRWDEIVADVMAASEI